MAAAAHGGSGRGGLAAPRRQAHPEGSRGGHGQRGAGGRGRHLRAGSGDRRQARGGPGDRRGHDAGRDPGGARGALRRHVDAGAGFAVIVDYKSSSRKLEPLKMEHGLQLQLLAYLAVATRVPEAAARLGYSSLRPAGAFYVCLNPQQSAASHRDAATTDPEAPDRKLEALKHRGRFDRRWIELLDRRCPPQPGQFSFRINKDGSFSKSVSDAVDAAEMARLMDRTLEQIQGFATSIFKGETQASPVEVKSERACDRCDYPSVCRFDPWVDRFRVLKAAPRAGGAS